MANMVSIKVTLPEADVAQFTSAISAPPFSYAVESIAAPSAGMSLADRLRASLIGNSNPGNGAAHVAAPVMNLPEAHPILVAAARRLGVPLIVERGQANPAKGYTVSYTCKDPDTGVRWYYNDRNDGPNVWKATDNNYFRGAWYTVDGAPLVPGGPNAPDRIAMLFARCDRAGTVPMAAKLRPMVEDAMAHNAHIPDAILARVAAILDAEVKVAPKAEVKAEVKAAEVKPPTDAEVAQAIRQRVRGSKA